MNPVDQFYDKQAEPNKSTLLALKEIILQFDPSITSEWKYGMPFFCCNAKMFFYLWIHKKQDWPYIGFVHGNQLEHPDLIQEKRAKMKILMINPNENLPIKTITELLEKALELNHRNL